MTFVQDFGHLRHDGASAADVGGKIAWRYIPHYEIAFLARVVVGKLPRKFFMKPAMEVDRIAAGARPCFVGEADRIAMLDLSGTKDLVDGHNMDFADFGSLISRSTRERQGEYFQQPVRLAISRMACQKRAWRGDAEIAAERSAVFQALGERTWLTPTPAQALTTLHVLHQYEASEYGLENMAGAVSEGRRILNIAQINDAEIDEADLRELIRTSMNFDYVDKAIVLAKKGASGTAFIHDFLVEMMKLRAANDATARRLRAAFRRRRRPLSGRSLGKRFVDKFMDYCLLLLAPGIPCAGPEESGCLIVTTQPIVIALSLIRLRPAERTAEVIFTLPAGVLGEAEQSGYNFYHFYGLLIIKMFMASAQGRSLSPSHRLRVFL